MAIAMIAETLVNLQNSTWLIPESQCFAANCGYRDWCIKLPVRLHTRTAYEMKELNQLSGCMTEGASFFLFAAAFRLTTGSNQLLFHNVRGSASQWVNRTKREVKDVKCIQSRWIEIMKLYIDSTTNLHRLVLSQKGNLPALFWHHF
jgi:hypothetical protein